MRRTEIYSWYEFWRWPALWLVVVLTGLFTRSYFPIDETRYLGIAWEMWLSSDWLVPHLNGHPYSHKPPLLFWLIVAGWKLFGVNAWWPRIVPSLFALGNLALTRWLGRRLCPEEPLVMNAAPLLLQGTLLWAVFTTMLMFDMLMVFFVLVALTGIVVAAAGAAGRGWLLTGLATGLALLSKGPVALLYILPPALVAPWWASEHTSRRWSRWYGGLAVSLVIGISLALCWAVPAALAGGPDYADAIFWGQTAHRISGDIVPHARPVWWYVAAVPVFVFPWMLWPPAWRGLAGLSRPGSKGSVRFCAAWLAPALVVLSFIESKQPQYLLPLLPAFALLTAQGIARLDADDVGRWGMWLPASCLALLGIALAIVPLAVGHIDSTASLQGISMFWGAGLLLAAVGLGALPARTPKAAVTLWSTAIVALMVFLHVGPLQSITAFNDARPLGHVLLQLQHDGVPIAWLHAYDDQYQFAGRLTCPLDVVGDSELMPWIATHPDGAVVVRYRAWDPSLTDSAIYAQRWRGGAIAVWQAAKLTPHR
ncbi:MAG: ArnT family glycosyltransferase [Woeseia sp.]